MAPIRIVRHPVVQHKLTELRDQRTGPKRFRELLREITPFLLYEATQGLEVEEVSVSTPMGEARGQRLRGTIGLVPILRAGLGMVESALQMFPEAQVWHLGIYRDEHTLQPIAYYNRLPPQPTVTWCFILDPMLATGGSAVAAADILKRWGVPHIVFVGLIAAPEGLERFAQAHPEIPVYVAAVDSHLNPHGFIVPGLGDAGDRQFGTGIQP
ncbi:MAG: uracil phosphoribosyltransferase [Thermoflexus sp.]|nr:uracil phosphoribosyltransferase [Thermoflexus sp.]